MPDLMRTLLILILMSPTLAACTQLEQVTDTIAADWNQQFGDAEGDARRAALQVHLYNFDTFICDAARQLIVSFNPKGTSASIMFEGDSLLLTRDAQNMPFTQAPYAMYIMDDGTLLLEKHLDVVYKHCRPLVNDPVITTTTTATTSTYDYTPTITPDEARGDALFREQMRK